MYVFYQVILVYTVFKKIEKRRPGYIVPGTYNIVHVCVTTKCGPFRQRDLRQDRAEAYLATISARDRDKTLLFGG